LKIDVPVFYYGCKLLVSEFLFLTFLSIDTMLEGLFGVGEENGWRQLEEVAGCLARTENCALVSHFIWTM